MRKGMEREGWKRKRKVGKGKVRKVKVSEGKVGKGQGKEGLGRQGRQRKVEKGREEKGTVVLKLKRKLQTHDSNKLKNHFVWTLGQLGLPGLTGDAYLERVSIAAMVILSETQGIRVKRRKTNANFKIDQLDCVQVK